MDNIQLISIPNTWDVLTQAGGYHIYFNFENDITTYIL